MNQIKYWNHLGVGGGDKKTRRFLKVLCLRLQITLNPSTGIPQLKGRKARLKSGMHEENRAFYYPFRLYRSSLTF